MTRHRGGRFKEHPAVVSTPKLALSWFPLGSTLPPCFLQARIGPQAPNTTTQQVLVSFISHTHTHARTEFTYTYLSSSPCPPLCCPTWRSLPPSSCSSPSSISRGTPAAAAVDARREAAFATGAAGLPWGGASTVPGLIAAGLATHTCAAWMAPRRRRRRERKTGWPRGEMGWHGKMSPPRHGETALVNRRETIHGAPACSPAGRLVQTTLPAGKPPASFEIWAVTA